MDDDIKIYVRERTKAESGLDKTGNESESVWCRRGPR